MNVYFLPWVGSEYDHSSPKVLIIGDSHYCGDCEECGVRGNRTIEEMEGCSNFTKNTIKDYLSFREGTGEKELWMTKTFLRFDKIYFGKEDVSVAESLELWNSVAFCNFLQTAASVEASNNNYTLEDYSRSSPMVTEIINELQPDIVIVWGNNAWDSLANEGWQDGAVDYTGTYTLSTGHIVHCGRIYHPSRANVEQWHPEIEHLLSSVTKH
jgi:hypothetical protein